MTYAVIWEINIEADSPEEAAKEGIRIQQDPESLASHFHVVDEDGVIYEVDLLEDEELEDC